MKLRAATIVSALGLLGSPGGAVAQPPAPPAEVARPSPAKLFERAQAEVAVGRFDAAGETLKLFKASNPTPAEYRSITDREATAFQRLRYNVPVWSDNAAANAEYKQVVAELTLASEAATLEFARDPARVAKFVRNLAETDEERVFAEQQLRLGGEAVVAPLVDAIRTANDPTREAQFVGAVTKLNPGQLPGLLASSLGLPLETRLAILRAAVARPDAQSLSGAPDTDLRPHLWYYASARSQELSALREFSALTLDGWTRGQSGRTTGPAELVAISRPLAKGTGRFRGDERVAVWEFDAAKSAPVARLANVRQANDYYALRNLRWALERAPGDPDATELFLSTTIERAVEAAQFGDVLEADPRLLPILAAADSATLNGLLVRALDDKKTALALGLTQLLALRADKLAAAGPLLRALDYPDPRVQLAAVVGLLKVPGSVPGVAAGRVVDILRRAAAAEAAPAGAPEVGRALIADPADGRGAKLARYLTELGYRAERFGTGRQLAGRLRIASDADLIFVDRHVGDPLVGDLLASLRADRDASSRPLFLVASDDALAALPLDRLLLRLAIAIAVADTNAIKPPEPFRYDPIRRLRPEEVAAARAKIVADRDSAMIRLYEGRLAQLERLVGGGSLNPSETLRTYLALRLPQLTLAALGTEYPLSAESAPEAFKLLTERTRTLELNPRLRNAATGLDTDRLARVAEDLDATLDPARRAMFEAMLARADSDALLIPRDKPPEPALVDRLDRVAAGVGGVRVIPEPFSRQVLQETIQKATADPAQLPVPQAVKRRNARLAVDLLRRMAVGEITGFDVRPAEAALRATLRDDELAPLAADAVARFGSAEAQQDLVNVALGVARPLAVRLQAADRAIQHAGTFGPLAPPAQRQAIQQTVAGETDPGLRGRLAVLDRAVAPRPADLSRLIVGFPLPLPPDAIKPEATPAPVPTPGSVEPGKN